MYSMDKIERTFKRTDGSETRDGSLLCSTVDHAERNRTKGRGSRGDRGRVSMGDRGRFKRKEGKSSSRTEESNISLSVFCLLQDSAHHIIQIAGSGDLKEFERLYSADPSLLYVQNGKGHAAVHVAAIKGQINILEFIALRGGDFDLQNCQGNTALHLAVHCDQINVINFLIEHGASTDIHNNDRTAPIHVAVTVGSISALKALLQHDQVDVNQAGESGFTPLHYCALSDNDKGAELLLEYGAKPCVKCDFGFYAIHAAAKSASSTTLEVLIKHSESLGYTREAVLSWKDMENNMPLHSAVNGGNIKAVEVCLKAGAPVNVLQDDRATPVHFACLQGNLDMLHLMYNAQPGNFENALHVSDSCDMTPLHRAALFNHVAVVRFLVEKGADVNAKDCHGRTPLLLSASKCGWLTVKCLLENKADLCVKDEHNRNFLHIAIKFGGNPNDFVDFEELVKSHLNEKDDYGCTPLHYACKEGHLKAVDELLKMGASVNVKNNEKQSPFHFAARYGRFMTCKRLLETDQGPNIINETDAKGRTALHIASMNGYTKIISLLMQKGAVFAKDYESNNALHYAAMNGYTQSIRLLVSVHSNLLNAANVKGETALHAAAKNGKAHAVTLLLTLGARITKNNDNRSFFDYILENQQTEVALAVVDHERWEDVMNTCSGPYGCPMLGLIKQLPEVCMAVLDRCQQQSLHDTKSKDYFVEYNYKYLQCPMEYVLELKRQGEPYTPMLLLNVMVKNGRVECLSHPLCVSFLNAKWNDYGKYFCTMYLFIYMAYLGLLTAFVVSHESLHHYDTWSVDNETLAMLGGNFYTGYQFRPVYATSLWIITIYSVLNIMKEIVHVFRQRARYFLEIQNLLQISLYTLSMLFAGPFLFGLSFHWQWEAGAVVIFLAWFNAMVFLQRFDFFGIYVVMFLEILRTLFQVLCVFSILIIAFGLAFFMLLNQEESKAFNNPALALLKTATMMLELDYMNSFNKPYNDDSDQTLHFSNLTLAFLAVFILLMPILLVNLLTGLAVGDIVAVQRDAQLKRLAMQVELYTDLERKMPAALLSKLDRMTQKIYPNQTDNTLHNLWTKVTNNDEESSSADGDSVHNSQVFSELEKQKKRIKEISSTTDRCHELLRLVIQKLEIPTEDDVWDEGIRSADSVDSIIHTCHSLPEASGVSKWRNSFNL
ncbi:transient receptor potential cation channel subfamily A member 1-like isoform X2 [Gigantopelta aegis]|uniref:transient receptor potential cation channel subfamily A member 1-like isoform X2 n=1 Tax=Gigantopelta aegis TaxID=1735272 RepID=UPI001B887C16|nr:transient receptor potential cation channel subfamily A member 1-like isoform X2 [Gigantopelta aegis]